jgi:anti-sigma factor RsiW
VSTFPTPLSHTEIEELLGAYALDAVDPETASAIEAHLDECVRCSIEVAQHHEVAGLLANSGGSPPAELWDGIAGQLGGTSNASWDRLAARLEGPDAADTPNAPVGPVPPGVTAGSSPPASAVVVPLDRARRSRVVTVAAGLVAAAAAVIALVFGVQVDHLHTQVNALQSGSQLSAAERAALAAPGTRRIALADPTGTGSPPATIVLTAAGTGFVVNHDGGLVALPDDRTYQLWGVVGSNTISLGLLGSHPGIVPFSVAGSPVSAFAITDEVAGGVVKSANQPVAVGTVQV